MKKIGTIGIWMLLLVLIVLAAAPTVPPTLLPADGSIYFDDPTLTCSGSTDGDGDDIYYQFFNFTSPADYSSAIVINPSTSNWADGRTYCQNLAGNWDLITIDNVEMNDEVDVKGAGIDYLWIGANSIDAENTWEWVYDSSSIVYENWATSYPVSTVGGDDCAIFCSDGTAGGLCVAKEWINDDCTGTNKQAVCYNFDFSIDSTPMQNTTATTFTWEDLPSGIHNWTCKSCDDTAACSGFAENLTVTTMDFYNCTGGNISLNFTGYDEEEKTLLVPDYDLDVSLTLSSATDSKLYSFALTGNQSYQLCLDPAGVEVNVSGFVEYGANNDSYSYPRQYYFDNAQIDGGDQMDISLYQLEDDLATAVTFNAIRDSVGVSDIIIHLQRYDPGTGTYTLVAMGETGASGNDIIYLRLTDAWYRVFAYEDGVLVYSSDAEHILSTTYNMYLSGGGGGYSDWWDDWFAFDDITYNLYYNDTTNYTVLTADDSTGATTSMCLKVDKYAMGNIENICYTCESTASVSMSCELVDQDAYYIAKFVAYHDDQWKVIDQIEISLSSGLGDLIGKDGLLYAFLIVGMFAFIGLWNPVIAIILTLIGVIVIWSLGLISMSFLAIAGLVVAGAVLMFKLKT